LNRISIIVALSFSRRPHELVAGESEEANNLVYRSARKEAAWLGQ
jgi:hypothetical protein